MKNILLTFLLLALTTNSFWAQKTTLKDFNLPEKTLAVQIMEANYNGETKEFLPISQQVLVFKNGKLTEDKYAMADKSYGSQTVNEYNEAGQLNKSSFLSFNKEKPVSSITTYQYVKENNLVAVYETSDNGYKRKTEDRNYNTSGNLVSSVFYDQNGDKMKTVTYFDNHNDILYHYKNNSQKSYQPNLESIYYSGNQILFSNTIYVDKELQQTIVKTTDYLYDDDNNLIEMNITNTYEDSEEKARNVFNILNKSFNTKKSDTSKNTKKLSYSNYKSNGVWTAQIPEKLTLQNQISLTFRTIMTTDEKTYTITDQNELLKFLDDTYQKIKAQKP
ncbi:hypothetical protein [Confluentibacter sediminis]|uniref:hypothetical protein n=1 Tax=Confluentibacter sediminis TaxID=2219045 RepID=UPI000DABD6BC|nr:hypothetical protein [Confluentibacter sediminis]